MHLLIAIPHLTVPGKRWCQQNFVCGYCGNRDRPRFRKRSSRKVIHFFEARVPIYWFECTACGRISYLVPAGLRKHGQYTEAVRFVVAVRHVLGFKLSSTQAFLSRWGIGGPWIKRCVDELSDANEELRRLHRRNRQRNSVFRLVGMLDTSYGIRPSQVTDIETGFLLVSLRGDRQGKQTVLWINWYIQERLDGTGAGLRVFERKPFLTAKKEPTLQSMESTEDMLRLTLARLYEEEALYQPEKDIDIIWEGHLVSSLEGGVPQTS